MPVATTYITDPATGRPLFARATISVVGSAAGGTSASVANGLVKGHMGNAHPYHHERGHLIGKQLGGDGGDARNLVGLSDGTNAPLMSDIEGECRDIIMANGPGSTVFLEVEVDWTAAYYNGPTAAPWVPGMVGRIIVRIFSSSGGALLFEQGYPNGVVKNHAALGCC
ncbi:DNA/RNA non-specific endonuclease [Hahella ganghwensis]|uniref:DNA/RNA non-specific endonuclease n=1 Tax=Hahella ganghwensis TaxID=286420 RepID=UPI00036C82F1|nr:DNA/RNA non-specific endonuclease [Hahella ganghwensis]